jgi:nitrate/TMAO reductase-like tetraheme cytochrome c subunit
MVPGVRTVATYVGTAKCLACHPSAAAVWTASAHAQAFKMLIARGADADPKCIGCHTIGFGSPSGYRREFGANRLVDVGCESCHGSGSLHVREKEGDTSIQFNFRPLDAGDCQKCHHGEFSRPFDWNEFWPLIKHGNEPPHAGATTALSQ